MIVNKFFQKPGVTYFSFGNTVEAFGAGVIEPTDRDRYVFVCRPSRIFNSGIPGYVARMEGREQPNTVLLAEADLKPETVAKWNKLKSMLEKAYAEDRITFLVDEAGYFTTEKSMVEMYLELSPKKRYWHQSI